MIFFFFYCFFFFNVTPTTEIYTLSLHDALPIWVDQFDLAAGGEVLGPLTAEHDMGGVGHHLPGRSEEHPSELQLQAYLVCRLLLEKKNNTL